MLSAFYLGRAMSGLSCRWKAYPHAGIREHVHEVRASVRCSVHHSHDATHAAGLCAEPAAGFPHERQLFTPGGGTPGMTGNCALSIARFPDISHLGSSPWTRSLCA